MTKATATAATPNLHPVWQCRAAQQYCAPHAPSKGHNA